MIHLKEIDKIYRGKGIPFHALKNVSMKIEEGEFVTVIGSSGSGKSTLLQIIGLLDGFDSGEYMFNGQNVSHMKSTELTKLRLTRLGFVFQSFHLLGHLTALENVELPLGYLGYSLNDRRKKAYEMLDRVGLREKVDQKPGQLSGGEQQRVAIARALINSPKLILADEPTGNLDSGNSKKIMEIFRDLHKDGKTIMMVTHDQSVIDQAKKTYHIQDGSLNPKTNM